MSERSARGPGAARVAAIAGLNDAVDSLARAAPSLPLVARPAGWGPHEVLAHLVFWHETYVGILEAHRAGRPPRLAEGAFSELNRAAVQRLAGVPAEVLAHRLLRANRRLGLELAKLPPSARIRIKEGARARGPVEFARRVAGHFRGHLAELRRQSRTASQAA